MKMIVNSITLRSHAVRYETAIRAIGGIASMRLDAPAQLTAALAILDREGSNLRFHRLSLIVFGINDYTFRTALKKACPDKATTQALIRDLRADPKAALKLNGAQVLKMRLLQSIEADAATLRRVAERFHQYGRSTSRKPGPVYDPYRNVDDAFGVFLVTAALGIMSGLAGFGSIFDDVLAEYSVETVLCMLAAVKKLEQCQSRAQNSTPLDKALVDKERLCAICYSEYLAQLAQCLRPPVVISFPGGVLPKFVIEPEG